MLCLFDQDDYQFGGKCCCPSDFIGDKYMVTFQTLNTTWISALGDLNSRWGRDKLKFFNKELNKYIIKPALESKLKDFEIVKFKRGPGGVVLVEAKIVLKQSHFNNSQVISESLRSKAISHNYETKGSKEKNL